MPAPPQHTAVLQCPCCNGTYRYISDDIVRGIPKRNPLCTRKQPNGKMDGAVVVAASIVAAIRLRGQEIKPSPKLTATIRDSVDLARMVLAELQR
jgi:hypothetical protein